MKHHFVANWAIAVIIVLLLLRMAEGYMVKPGPSETLNLPLNVQDTITGDKKYIYI